MANWALYRDEDGNQVAVNLDAAAMMVPVKERGEEIGTRICFPGDREWTYLDSEFSKVLKAASESN